MIRNKNILLALCFLLPLAVCSQSTTRKEEAAEKPEAKNKVLIVPFENKLYLSEIDLHINKETKWSAKQIRHFFRVELDKALRDKFSPGYSPVTLMKDTAKSKKDLGYIHNSIGYSYDPIPGEKMQGPDAKNSSKPKIKNGEVVVESDYTKRFMNTVVAVKEMLGFVEKKFSTQYIVFINELDLKRGDESTYDIATDTYQRIISVHYTITDKAGKKINAGLVHCSFASNVNEPKKIVGTCFGNLAKAIYENFTKAITPSPGSPAPSKK